MDDRLKIIKKLNPGISILYVEDNLGLSENMTKLLSRMFDNIFVAHDGEEGYKKYLESKPKIIITDINMPHMNGFEMIKKIKAIDCESKVIVMSAYDEKKHLHIAINLGVFRYLNKPAKVPELINAIYDTVIAIHKEENQRIFLNQIQSIFNYQNNLVIMMIEGGEFVLPNQRFLEFFEIDSIDDFMKKYDNIDELLLEHKEFLYSTPSSHWYDIIVDNPGKLFHTKIQNSEGEMRHLILKLREVPEKEKHYILSFDDVTELNLMALYDSELAENDKIFKEKESVLTFLKVIKDNSAEVKIHNFYKGLTIVNPAVITEITDNDFTLKTVNAQLKIVQISKFMTISSELFPKSVICKTIKSIDHDSQSIVVDNMNFSPRSATDRNYIRLEPDIDHHCTLFYKEIKYTGDTRIVDISEVSVKIEINALPAGIQKDTEVTVAMNLKLQNQQISMTVEAKVYRIDTSKRYYHLVLLYELDSQNLNNIKEYLVNRQMSLIREFKKVDITTSNTDDSSNPEYMI